MTEKKTDAIESQDQKKPHAGKRAFETLTQVDGMSRAGAALMAAHMLVDLGDGKVRALTAEQVREYMGSFLQRVPMASTSIAVGHIVRFVTVCKMYGLECESAEHYQKEVMRLVPGPTGPMVAPKAEVTA